MGIEAINAFELPLLNTVLLLASGVTITFSHHCLIQGSRKGALYGGFFTLILAMIFTGFQYVEYSVSSFTLSDGAYGSCCAPKGYNTLCNIVTTIIDPDLDTNTWDSNCSILPLSKPTTYLEGIAGIKCKSPSILFNDEILASSV